MAERGAYETLWAEEQVAHNAAVEGNHGVRGVSSVCQRAGGTVLGTAHLRASRQPNTRLSKVFQVHIDKSPAWHLGSGVPFLLVLSS